MDSFPSKDTRPTSHFLARHKCIHLCCCGTHVILLPLYIDLKRPKPVSFLDRATLLDCWQMFQDLIWSRCGSERSVGLWQKGRSACWPGCFSLLCKSEHFILNAYNSQWHYNFKVSLDKSTSLLSSARAGLPFCLALSQIIMDYRVHVYIRLQNKTHLWERVVWQWTNPYLAFKYIHYLIFSSFTTENLCYISPVPA